MEKKIKLTTIQQFETLIGELENKVSLAKGFDRSANPHNFKQEWEEITLKLNSIGPPIRDSEGWQRVWRDFKCKLKKKLTHNKAEVNATGGGIYKQLQLSPLEETAANFLQFEKQLSPGGKVQGVSVAVDEILTQNFSDIDVTVLEVEDNMPSTSATVSQVQEETNSNPRKRKLTKDERKVLFERHNAIHEQAFDKISKTISELKTILEESKRCEENTLSEVKNILKETCRYQRKLWEVEDKKMKIMEKKCQREEKLFEAEMKLKAIKMEIKKKELEVLQNKYT